MEEILSIKKSESETYSLTTVVDVFKTTDDLETINKYVENAEDRLYVGWASVDAVDKANEKIPIQDVIAQQEILLKRGGPISNEHTNAIVGKTHAYKIMVHPITKTLGVLHLNQIYKDNTKDNEVWKDIVDKKKKGSSVAGTYSPKDSYTTLNNETGGFVKVLSGFGQYETAVTEKPCNAYATIEANSVVAKSEQKMGNPEVKKEELVVDAPVAAPAGNSDEEFKNNVMALFAKINERLDAIEERVSGGVSEEAPVEESKAEEPVKEEATEDKKPEDEMEKKDLKKELAEMKKSIEDLKKSQVVEVVKSERPNIAETKAEDIQKSIDAKLEEMKKSGNFSFKEMSNEIKKAQDRELAKKLNQ